jgi:hypothetical protein
MAEGEGPAGVDAVALRYRPTRREIFAVIVALDQLSRPSAVLAVVGSFLALGLLAGGDLVQAMAWAAFPLVFSSGLLGGTLGTLRRQGWIDTEVAKVFDCESIRTETDLSSETVRWAAIKQVTVLRRALVFADVQGLVFAVPRRALTTDQERAVLRFAGNKVVERWRPWLRPLGWTCVGVLAYVAFSVASNLLRF